MSKKILNNECFSRTHSKKEPVGIYGTSGKPEILLNNWACDSNVSQSKPFDTH